MAEMVRQYSGGRIRGLVHAWRTEPAGKGWHPDQRLLRSVCGRVVPIMRFQGDTLSLPITCAQCERKIRQEVV